MELRLILNRRTPKGNHNLLIIKEGLGWKRLSYNELQIVKLDNFETTFEDIDSCRSHVVAQALLM